MKNNLACGMKCQVYSAIGVALMLTPGVVSVQEAAVFPSTIVPPPILKTDLSRTPPDTPLAEEEFLGVFARIGHVSAEASYHADILLWAAERRYRNRRHLNFMAGLLALLCSAAVTAVLTGLVAILAIRYLAALSALASGLVSLINSHLHDDWQTERLFNGAAKLRAVQKAAELLRDRPLFLSLEAKATLAASGGHWPTASPAMSHPDELGRHEEEAIRQEREQEFRRGAEAAYKALSELRHGQTDAAEHRAYLDALIAANQRAYDRQAGRMRSAPAAPTRPPAGDLEAEGAAGFSLQQQRL